MTIKQMNVKTSTLALKIKNDRQQSILTSEPAASQKTLQSFIFCFSISINGQYVVVYYMDILFSCSNGIHNSKESSFVEAMELLPNIKLKFLNFC